MTKTLAPKRPWDSNHPKPETLMTKALDPKSRVVWAPVSTKHKLSLGCEDANLGPGHCFVDVGSGLGRLTDLRSLFFVLLNLTPNKGLGFRVLFTLNNLPS